MSNVEKRSLIEIHGTVNKRVAKNRTKSLNADRRLDLRVSCGKDVVGG